MAVGEKLKIKVVEMRGIEPRSPWVIIHDSHQAIPTTSISIPQSPKIIQVTVPGLNPGSGMEISLIKKSEETAAT